MIWIISFLIACLPGGFIGAAMAGIAVYIYSKMPMEYD